MSETRTEKARDFFYLLNLQIFSFPIKIKVNGPVL